MGGGKRGARLLSLFPLTVIFPFLVEQRLLLRREIRSMIPDVVVVSTSNIRGRHRRDGTTIMRGRVRASSVVVGAARDDDDDQDDDDEDRDD